MANPLQSGQPIPEPPEINSAAGDQQGAAPMAGGNVLAQSGAGAMPGMPGAQPGQQARPSPTHAQTVAAMRHFSEINREFEPLLKNPELGKADMKSSIIDAVTRLVSERIVTPAAAVMQLASVPSNPREQRQWMTKLYQDNAMASAVILQQHRQAFGGQPDNPNDIYSADKHLDHINGVMGQYRQGG